MRSDIEDNRIFGIRLEIEYDDNKRPEIKVLIFKGNLFPELITMPPPVLSREG
jgi:hypothetical protein